MPDIDWNDPAYGVPEPRQETAEDRRRKARTRPCDQCMGTGKIDHEPCPCCGGVAYVFNVAAKRN